MIREELAKAVLVPPRLKNRRLLLFTADQRAATDIREGHAVPTTAVTAGNDDAARCDIDDAHVAQAGPASRADSHDWRATAVDRGGR
ncbi:hypothetical protein AJ87_31870 [Rhizobium yanglingense]|nr:hypothetical protein AJ87_31870 [Rhizobium yanglingense]